MKNKKETLEERVKRIHKQVLKEVSAQYPSKTGEFSVGDIVGNTVQGFNFEVLKIDRDSVTVKNTKTGSTGKYYIHNFYKS